MNQQQIEPLKQFFSENVHKQIFGLQDKQR